MRTHRTAIALPFAAGLLVTGLALTSRLSAQGCEPIRFTTPVSLGGEGETYQASRQWRLTLAYRRLFSNEFFVGTSEDPAKGPGGLSPVFRINTLVANVAYAVNDRVRVSLSVPYSSGSFTRKWPDAAFHTQTASGLGDVNLAGDVWLLNPRKHQGGNLALGLGVKAPTGRHDVRSRIYTATSSSEYPADQPIQPGDGGWGFTLQAQGFRQVQERTFLYAGGSYMANPRAKSDVRQTPTGAYWSVPDVYSGRAGAAFSLFPDLGLTVSLGGRIDGIPVNDLIGGGDDVTVKRSAYVIFADPGLSLTRGSNNLAISIPVRMMVNRQKSVLEQNTNGTNGGGFAKYLIYASYSYRL